MSDNFDDHEGPPAEKVKEDESLSEEEEALIDALAESGSDEQGSQAISEDEAAMIAAALDEVGEKSGEGDDGEGEDFAASEGAGAGLSSPPLTQAEDQDADALEQDEASEDEQASEPELEVPAANQPLPPPPSLGREASKRSAPARPARPAAVAASAPIKSAAPKPAPSKHAAFPATATDPEAAADPDDDEIVVEPELQVDADLLATVEDIVTRREHTLGLIAAAEDKKDQVKPEIYARVVSDYRKTLRAVEREYEPVSLDICGALTEISRREASLRTEREEVNDVIVEMRFRCEVGEFPEEDLFPIEAENASKLKALNARLEVVDQTYIVCQKFLRQDDFDAAIRGELLERAAVEPEAEDEVEAEVQAEAEVEVAAEVEAEPEADGEAVTPVPGEMAEEIAEALADASAPAAQEEVAEDVDIDVFDPEEEPEVFTPDPQQEGMVTDPAAPRDAATPVPDGDGPATSHEAWQPQHESDMTQDLPEDVGERVRCYLVLKTESGDEESHPLGLEAFAIGRHPKNDMVLSDRGISRRHARVVLENTGRYSIADLSSGNGIFVNGERVEGKTELNNGDHVVMGNCQLCYLERLE